MTIKLLLRKKDSKRQTTILLLFRIVSFMQREGFARDWLLLGLFQLIVLRTLQPHSGLILWSTQRISAFVDRLKPHLHGRKFLALLGWKKYAYQKNWFGTDRFSRVNDFAPSVPDQNFTRARTMSRGSPSTDKTGTRSWKSSPARIQCAV